MALQDLPPEILLMCLEKLDNPHNPSGRDFSALANARLTCKRLSEIIIPILFSHVTVRLSATSLQRLEELFQNPAIAESVFHISIVLPCYDPLLVEDLSLFADILASRMKPMVDWLMSDYGDTKEITEIKRKISGIGFKRYSEWRAAARSDDDINDLTHNTKLLKEIHQDYRRLYHEQQLAQQERKPVMLLSGIFKRSKKLRQISVLDKQSRTLCLDENIFSDKVWKSGFLPALAWCGRRYGPDIATPGKLIVDIFDAMEMSSTHPHSFRLHISNLPLQLRAFEISHERLARISTILSDTKSMSIFFKCGPDDRTGIRYLEDLTHALCDISALERLDLDWTWVSFNDEYLSAACALPLGKQTWTRLKFLGLFGFGLQHDKFQALLNQCNKDVLEKISISHIILLSGSWEKMIEDLRSFHMLKRITFKSVYGAEMDPCMSRELEESLHREIEWYILREIDDNPLLMLIP